MNSRVISSAPHEHIMFVPVELPVEELITQTLAPHTVLQHISHEPNPFIHLWQVKKRGKRRRRVKKQPTHFCASAHGATNYCRWKQQKRWEEHCICTETQKQRCACEAERVSLKCSVQMDGPVGVWRLHLSTVSSLQLLMTAAELFVCVFIEEAFRNS